MMKQLFFLLTIAVGFGAFAGTPQLAETTPTYVIQPQPLPENPPNGYILDCCHAINYGYSWVDGCHSIGLECWGECGNHGWLITVCKDHTEIIGALVEAPDDTPTPVKISVTTGVIDIEKFDKEQDPIKQMTEINKIKNGLFNLTEDLTIVKEEGTFIYKAGIYQVSESNLLVTAFRTYKY